MRGLSVCKECIEDKIRYKNSTLPCLELENAWASGRFPTAKESLCRAGPYHWCPKFCNVPDRVIEIKVCKELSDVASKVRPIWFAKKV